MSISEGFFLSLGIQLISIGVFVGVVKSSLAQIFNRLEKMEAKQEKELEETATIRERLAVIEFELNIKNKKS